MIETFNRPAHSHALGLLTKLIEGLNETQAMVSENALRGYLTKIDGLSDNGPLSCWTRLSREIETIRATAEGARKRLYLLEP